MAWISVHEQVLGRKLNVLSSELKCSQNEALGLLVRFWLWSINCADKYGYIESVTRKQLASVLAVGLNEKLNAEEVVDVLISHEWIDSENEGLYIHDWEHWQEYWYKALAIRQKDAARKREERRKEKEKAGASLVKIEEPKPKIEELKKPLEKNDDYSKEFIEFWELYPRKIGKADAYKKYKTRLKDGWSPDELKKAAESYAREVSSKHTELQYVKHPKTFLSDSTPFVDYIPKKSESNDNDPFAEWRDYG